MDTHNIPFSRPYIRKEEEEAVLRVLRSGWLTTGQETLAFEKEFAAFFSSTDDSLPPLVALGVNSATSGLHLALEACGVGAGDVVLVPSYTFTATAEVVRYLGADAVFVDTAPGTFHIDPKALEYTLERLCAGRSPYPWNEALVFRGQPKALIPVHYGGLPCNMEAIMDIAARYHLKVIEDAAHSFPSRISDGSWIGTIGDAGVFSFYATKTITTGEGGMVVSRDPHITARIGIMRSHGIDRSVWNRYTDNKASWYYEVVEAGYKYNIPDILSAMGRVQLSRAMMLLEMRKEIADIYDSAFKEDTHLALPPTGSGDARHLYPLRLNLETITLSRDAVIKKMQDAGVGVSVHFIPLHTMPYYKKQYHFKDDDFPESLQSFKRVISLPLWPGMERSQIEKVIAVVKSIVQEYTV